VAMLAQEALRVIESLLFSTIKSDWKVSSDRYHGTSTAKVICVSGNLLRKTFKWIIYDKCFSNRSLVQLVDLIDD
jgi:hypothetical protein